MKFWTRSGFPDYDLDQSITHRW